ncbi:MAG: hypothetical protein PHI12_14355 [Dehalococcoidales bacterium]|nr:hypothetical protein [Dehalococcoidales bacterium]
MPIEAATTPCVIGAKLAEPRRGGIIMSLPGQRIFDLQLFAEEEAEEAESTPAEGEESEEETEEETETKEESQDTETEGAPEETPAEKTEEYDEIIFNRQPVKIPKSERQTYLQKGYHYDTVRQERDRVLAAIKALGYDSVEAFDEAVRRQKAEQEAYDKGEDPETYYQRQQQEERNKKLESKLTFFEQKERLSELHPRYNEAFYNQHRKEIEGLAQEMTGGNLVHAYSMVLLDKLDDYIRLSTAASTQKASEIAEKAVKDFQRQSKRGTEPSDGAPVNEERLDLNDEELEWARRRVNQGHYKSIKEAWSWLRGKKK